ncbi:bifunctional adenosylcobinamide kinase/adenosylcobinamide-phosphate guanylyltransferase [Lacrimispora sp. JR3]|uniref:bifunctional adenosylcobinamide kinase/adenosylcobinamide-phosphate guanylyltransferase n=1 Tax=Lacrimispora sinapis TaxID=3111456 RepID=UPI003747A8D0
MVTLVIGGSGSGKSEYAEGLILSRGKGKRIYIATMKPWDEECEMRILRHRQMRADKEFDTVECYRNLKHLDFQDHGAFSDVLLECMSNLVSNELFGLGEKGEKLLSPKETVDEVMAGVIRLKEQAENIIIVTNEVFSDGDHYSRQTNQYREVLGKINRQVACIADEVIEVTAGIPIFLKGIN